MLLHFVLTRCMRLLGNSPYAPFIYNSAANAGHAGPHPRSVIRLRRRRSETRRLKQWCMVLIEHAHARTHARTSITRQLRVHAYSAAAHRRFFPLFLPASPSSISTTRPPVSLLARITHYREKEIFVLYFGKGHEPLCLSLSLSFLLSEMVQLSQIPTAVLSAAMILMKNVIRLESRFIEIYILRCNNITIIIQKF